MKSVNIVSHADNSLASHRMRCLMVANGLNQTGKYTAEVQQHGDFRKDVNIFHKHIEQERNLNEALFLADVTKVMFDICDDHFDKPYGDYYKSMVKLSEVITCNTANMQARIYEVTGRLAMICPDPIMFPFHEPVHSSNPDVVWYGHATNIFSIIPHIGKIPNLTIYTNARLPYNDKVRTKYWKPDLVENEISRYEIVVIPNISTPEAKMKSPNRAVDALHAGRFVIAESEEVYGELHEFIFLGSVEEGLQFYKDNPSKVLDMIKKGQEYILEKYNHKAVTEAWINAIEHEDLSRYDNA